MRLAVISLMLSFLAACQPDETVTKYLQGSETFVMQSIDGTSFEAAARIDLGEAGRVSGQAPCNSYFAEQSAPYPWFELGPIAATKRACPDLDAEQTFFDALATASLVEVSDPILILTNDQDLEMVFQAEP